MSDECKGKLPKPEMHGLLMKQIKFNVICAFMSAAAVGIAFKTLYIDRKKRKYRNFYRDYDIDKEFERMRSKHVFDSC